MNTRTIFDEDTDVDVFALGELSPEMEALVALLLEHTDDGTGKPLCGATEFEPDLLVGDSLSADCEVCRGIRMIGSTKEHKQRAVPVWDPQPMEGADTMVEEKQKRSDGR